MSEMQVTNFEVYVTEFTEASAQEFKAILRECTKRDSIRPIIVYIDSYGGLVDSLASMIETIDATPNPVITVASGKAISCGAILLSHGYLRFCGKHSRILIHEISGGAFGDIKDVINTTEHLKELNKYWMTKLASNCKIKGGYRALKKKLNQGEGHDLYLTPEKALEFGIIDHIGTPVIMESVSYDIRILD